MARGQPMQDEIVNGYLIDYNPPNNWYQDLYLNPDVHGECLAEIAAVLHLSQIEVELHAFPKSGYVHLYKLDDSSPLETTEEIAASVLEILRRRGINRTIYAKLIL